MRRSAVSQLPEAVRCELEQKLISNSFSKYTELAAWLNENGYEVSRSSVHRYGSQFESRIEAIRLSTEQAEALVAASPDDAGAVADASLRLAQERLFQVLLAAESGDLKELATAARALAETARAGTTIRQERRKAIQEAVKAAGNEGRKRGLSADTVAAIRRAIEGPHET